MPPESNHDMQGVRIFDVSTGHPMELITFQDAIMRLQTEARAIGRDIADAAACGFETFHYYFDDLDPGNIEDSAEQDEKSIDFDALVAQVENISKNEVML